MSNITFSQSYSAFPGILARNQEHGESEASPSSPIFSQVLKMSLRELLTWFNYVPAQTAILGVSRDGVPILFDLNDPKPGAMLVTGSSQASLRNLLKTMLHSLMTFNSTSGVNYYIISTQIETWMPIVEAGKRLHSTISTVAAQHANAGNTIIQLAEQAEQRYSGRQGDSPIILILDGVDLSRLSDFDVRLNLEWLIKNGPQVKIWPVISVASEQAEKMSRWIAQIKTRVLGKMENGRADHIGMYTGSKASILDPQREFVIRINQSWTRFWVPVMD
jgi:hypothetical protein